MPDGQSWHTVSAIAPENLPTGQDVHALLEALPENVPVPQAMQAALVRNPVPVWYVPETQLVHAETPEAPE